MSGPMIYRVTASALNLRATPAKTAAKLAVLSMAEQVVRIDDPTPTPGWMKISWRGYTGYVAELFTAPVDGGAPMSPPTPAPDAERTLTPAPPVERRDADLSKLHPTVRAAVSATVEALNGEGAPFRVFEAFRTPERQRWLYAQGRTRPGGVVTKAQAWQSYHQYGLAVDLVLFRANGWSWSSAGADAALWTRMHEVARGHGLRPLSFEAPHVEFAGPDWRDLQQGQGFPADGDDTWYDAVSMAAARWTAAAGSPPAPPLGLAERPPLDDPTP